MFSLASKGNFSTIIVKIFLQSAYIVASGRPAYVPIEDIILNCGAPADLNASDGRLWTSDRSSKFGPFESSHNESEACGADTQGNSDETVPYMTARVSTSEFNYTFHLTPGQKLVRLFFHPAFYNDFEFDKSKATFSVRAGSFTLLKNFAAYLVADSFSKEFYLNVEENEVLDLVFIPSPSASNDNYAFINGIEILSIPTNLYYTPPDQLLLGLPFVGQSYGIPATNDTALEMTYRFNVGGQSISPKEDSGLFRLWSDDSEYLTTDSYFTHDRTALLNYTLIPRYAAPEQVYRTAQVLGPNLTYNQRHNLSWKLPVDPEFTYMVRFHFCEIVDTESSSSDRVFSIFINGHMAELYADVISWTGHGNVPIYKDYVVLIPKEGKKNMRYITIDLHPYISLVYCDVLLNGIEVFKMNNSDGNLGGTNHELMVPPPSDSSNSTGRKSKMLPLSDSLNSTGRKSQMKRSTVITGVGCAAGLLTLLSLLACMVVWQHRKRQNNSERNWFLLIFRICSNRFAKNSSPAPPSDICRQFSLREIKTTTNNFDTNFIIGRGGFGDVYKGFSNAGSTPVAIKRLNLGSKQGLIEFKTEIEMLSRLRDQNLVSLIGYCQDNNEMILVYDYMAHGTLREHLYNTNNPPLPWEQRLKICIGAALGLHYLHRGPNHTIIHRDVKTTNILLNEKWVAKVSDFGLSKMNDLSNTHVSTAVKGGFGYLDPEYFRLHRLTEKSDVYSFGVVLFEVLCARAPIDQTAEDHTQISLAEWAKHCYYNGSLDQIIDPHLKDKIKLPSLLKFGEVAISCLASEGIKRPVMSEVVYALELALKLQGSEVNGNDENHSNDSSAVDYHVLFTSDSGSIRDGR